MSSQPQNAKQIFVEAIEQYAPDQWPEFLDRACGDDAELRRRVEILLEAHLGDESLLDVPAVAPAATIDYPITEGPGTVIGRYKLLEQIGEGGMGLVFMARQQEPIKRNVALKIIKPGMDTRQVIARFEAERQALAVMDHPNIAKVLDAGTTGEKGVRSLLCEAPEGPSRQKAPDPFFASTGRPYFVMELVKGIPITEYCDQERLSTRERLELFVPVCQAVQHAHQKGIIHRDIKPTNVLVTLHDGTPVPKVIDFGVAKAINQEVAQESLVTGFGQVIGTPLYMSPEQAEMSGLDIDTRTDVYALGVLLYELLTGTTPFEQERFSEASYDEMRRIIREEEPPKPSTRISTLADALETIAEKRQTDARTLTQQVRGELDWIVMKSLEKDRTRRYESANDLAKDVQRYLNDEAVEACPPSTAYRLKKFVRRNKAALVTVSAVALALIVGAGVATWQAIVATDARNLAKHRLDEVDEQRERAEGHFQKAMEAVDQMLTEVAAEELADVPHMAEVRERLLNKALVFYEGLQEQESDDPAAQRETARAQKRCGDIYQLLGKHEEAERAFRESIKRLEAIEVAGAEGAQVQNDLAKSLSALAALLEYLARHEEAIKTVNRALSIARASHKQAPREADYRSTLTTACGVLGASLYRTGRLKEAEAAYREAMQVARELAAESPDDETARFKLAASINSLAILLSDTGRSEVAEVSYREALTIHQQLASDHPKTPKYRVRLAAVHYNLAGLLSDTGQYDDAEVSYREALTIEQQLVADYPEVPVYRDTLGAVHLNLAILLAATGRKEHAEASYREGLAIHQQLAADYPEVPEYRETLGVAHLNLAILLAATGRKEDAEVSYREALAIQQQLAADYPEVLRYRDRLAGAHIGLANLLKAAGENEKAEESYRQALTVSPQLAADHPEVPKYRDTLARAHNNLAILLAATGRKEDAEASYREALTIREALVSDFPEIHEYRESLLNALHNYGWMLFEESRFQEAEETHRRALVLLDQLGEQKSDEPWAGWVKHTTNDLETIRDRWARQKIEESPDDIQLRYDYALLLARNGEHAAALVEFDEAIRLGPASAAMYMGRARAHLELGSSKQALEDSQEAIELDPDLAVAYSTRAVVLAQRGETEKAAADWEKALSRSASSENAASIYADRARSYAEVGDLDTAVADYTEAIELTGDDPLLFTERGFAYAASKEQEKAVVDWQQAKRLDPTCADTIELRLLGLSCKPTVADPASLGRSEPLQPFPWITEAKPMERPAAPIASFAAPDQSHGMTPANKGDGKYAPEEIDGVPVLVAERAYLYFNVDDELLHDLPRDTPVLVRVTLLDTKRQTVDIQYDGHVVGLKGGKEGRYRAANKYSMTGSGGLWHYDFLFRYPRLANRQNNKSDFRIRVSSISGGEKQLAMHQVQILAPDPQAEKYYAEVMQQLAELERSPDQPKDNTQTEQKQ